MIKIVSVTLIILLLNGCGAKQIDLSPFSQKTVYKVESLIEEYGGVNSMKDGVTPLNHIIESGDTEATKIVLLKGAKVNRVDTKGNSPLHIATQKGFIDILSLLLEHKANPNLKNEKDETPLHIASNSGFTDIVKLLVKNKADVDIKTEEKKIALHFASEKGFIDIVKELLDAGSDLNLKNRYGWTPLHYASENGNLKVVQILIQFKAKLNIKTDSGLTPLHNSLLKGNLEIAKLLIESGADLNIETDLYLTPLHIASKLGYFDIVKLIVLNGGELNIKSKDYKTALHFALENSHKEIAKYLIESGIKVKIEDKSDKRAIHLATEKGYLDIVKLLLEHKADVNAEDDHDTTPLHIASKLGYIDIARLLIENRADIDAEDDFDRTPLHLASKTGNIDIVKLLLEHKAEIYAEDDLERTPLHYSAIGGSIGVAQELIKAGAELKAQDRDKKFPTDLSKNSEIKGFLQLQEAMLDVNTTMIVELIKSGVNPNVQDRFGDTPLHFIVGVNSLSGVKTLIESGADRGIKNSKDILPISVAMKSGYIDIFNYLNGGVQSSDKTPPKLSFAYSEKLKNRTVERGLKRVGQKFVPKESKRIFESRTILIKGNIFDESKISEAKIGDKTILLSPQGDFEEEVELKLGENIFNIHTKDKYGNRTEEKFVIVVDGFQSDSMSENLNWYEKQYALIVGIDKYKNRDIPTLNNAVNDAEAVGKILRDMGFNVTSLYNKDATKERILKEFENIIKSANSSDNFLFYFAGHGQGVELNGDKEGYILPYDSDIDLQSENIFEYQKSAIPIDDLKMYSKAKNSPQHVALLLDSCFSGLAMTKRDLGSKKVEEFNSDYYNDILSRKAINILTAGDDEPVGDGYGHSPFTQAIIQALQNRGADIEDRDGFVTFTDLASYVKSKVEKDTTRRQRPQFTNLSSDDGDFIFKLND